MPGADTRPHDTRVHRRGRPREPRSGRDTACTIEATDGTLIDELHGGLGIATNNVAEYNGLLAALRWAVDHGQQEVQIRADSELLVKQMRGEYRVKHPACSRWPPGRDCSIGSSVDVTFEHVRREQNKEADRLSNLGMDEAEASAAPRRIRWSPSPRGSRARSDVTPRRG